LGILREEALGDNAKAVGERFVAGLRALQERYPAIGEVRGRGLMIGVEMIANTERAPAPEIARGLTRRMLEERVLVSTTGVHGNVIRITPPLVISSDQADQALEAFERGLQGLKD
jgi:4-aminobutyrate aminotransferase